MTAIQSEGRYKPRDGRALCTAKASLIKEPPPNSAGVCLVLLDMAALYFYLKNCSIFASTAARGRPYLRRDARRVSSFCLPELSGSVAGGVNVMP